jgi:glutathione peroxidase
VYNQNIKIAYNLIISNVNGGYCLSIYDYKVIDGKGNQVSLEEYRGKVLLIVNTATGCGFTPQYEGLQTLYEKYQWQEFEILDFPCNQFGNQAPGTNEEIASFCELKYNTTFHQFAKVEVNGTNEEPVFTYLKSQSSGVLGNKIKWNFTKFLVDKDGNVVDRFAPTTTPEKLEEKIKLLL